MPDAPKLQRAELRELDERFERTINPDRTVSVQFNPETLKVTFANQTVQGSGAGDQRGASARQFVGAGTTKLAVQTTFDVTAPAGTGAPRQDVRRLTSRVAYFITPRPQQGAGAQQPQYAPPAIRFIWGSFQFDGIMDSLEETLEFWSPDGRPLRATLSFALSQQKITFAFADHAGGGAPVGLGTQPLAQAAAGASLPSIAASAGVGASWQSIAAANGVEDALRLAPGRLVNLSARVGS